MSPMEAVIALVAIVLASLSFGPHGAQRCAATLAANWVCCQTYVAVTGHHAAWPWFWAIDFLSAVAVTIPPVSQWQRGLAYLYMFQFGFHAGFAIMGGDQFRYLYGLDAILILQMLVVFMWTTGHGLLRLCDARHWHPVWLYPLLGWTTR